MLFLQAEAAAGQDPAGTEPCHVRGIRDRARCLELRLPERWDRPDGRKISVHVAVLPAASGAAEPDPVFVLAGGPGQAASEMGRPVDHIFGKVRRRRALVLVDQRGTGKSTPLSCPLPPDAAAAPADWRPAQTCLAGLNADIAAFDSAAFIRDLDAVRAALGYERINLWGASWGTRAALLYARAFPQRVRTMVLDGVLPPSRNLFEFEPLSSEAALEKTLTACREDVACAAAFPGLRATLDRVMAELEAAPRQLSDPERRALLPVDRLIFMQNLRTALYIPEAAAAVPFIIDRFAAGDARPFFAFAVEMNRRITDRMYLGLTLSVLCTEEISAADRSTVAAAGAGSRFRTDYFEFWRTACAGWPRGERGPDYGAPVRAGMPVLLLSGGLDPVTPPDGAEEAARTLPRATHFVAPAAGHNVSAFGCAPDLIADFIAAADASGLDAACLEEPRRPPFLVGPQGPQP